MVKEFEIRKLGNLSSSQIGKKQNQHLDPILLLNATMFNAW